MSVTLNTMHILGSDLTAEKVAREIERNLKMMQDDADDMNVVLNWATVVIRLGEEYEEEYTFSAHHRHPILRVKIQADRRAE